ncbi:MAG: hypothetical protein SGJ13_19090 [Actinomycetota bacterium]|nr:hypothetical protein [Actinomycetota bacterium]
MTATKPKTSPGKRASGPRPCIAERVDLHRGLAALRSALEPVSER